MWKRTVASAWRPSARSSFRSVVDGFARERRHERGWFAHLARLLIRIGEADDLPFFIWLAEERDGHRQALGAEAHRNDDRRKSDRAVARHRRRDRSLRLYEGRIIDRVERILDGLSKRRHVRKDERIHL